MPNLLSIERRGEVAVVTLRRPEKHNALSIELRLELGEAFGALSEDDGVGCIVLTGAGSSFCSGMDTSQFGGDLRNRERLVETSTLAFKAVGECRRPVVAAINGPALAGGFALALLCDLRVAAQSASFGYPELPRGIPPSYAAARAVLPATVAQELCLTGRIVRADRGAAARDRARGRLRRRRWPVRWRSPSGSPGCPARRSSRPSAGRCSSAATCGASSSTTRSGSFAAPCSARTATARPPEPLARRRIAQMPDAPARIRGQT